ncbi:hypothetical protein JXO52_02030 [bacterium]|nr:hypothetical protein [bacterium]
MSKRRFKKLLAKEIEQGLSDHEKKWLDSYTAGHSEAKREYTHQLTISRTLSRMSTPDPSDNLIKTIMNSIDTNRYAARSTASGKKTAVNGFSRLFSPARVVTFTAGVAVGVMLILIAPIAEDQYAPVTDDFLGTVGLHGSGGFKPLFSQTLNEDRITGAIDASIHDTIIGFTVDIDAASPMTLTFSYNPQAINFFGVSSPDTAGLSFVKTVDRTAFSAFGRYRCLILFKGMSFSRQEIRLDIQKGGDVIISKTISLDDLH